MRGMTRKCTAMEPSERRALADRGYFDIPEDSEVSWRNYLSGFFDGEDGIWPVFKKHGFTPGEAMICWSLNKLQNEVENLRNVIEEHLV